MYWNRIRNINDIYLLMAFLTLEISANQIFSTFGCFTRQTFTRSNSTIKTLEKGVKYF